MAEANPHNPRRGRVMPYLTLPLLMMSASAVAFGAVAMVGAALVHGAIRQ